MSLPKLNAVPKYEVVVPSTGQTVKYRPFLVKEEKVLMMAVESEDMQAAVKSVVDTIDACIDGGIEKESLTTFDVEYLFTQIRTKSVGESANIKLACNQCQTENEVKVALDTIQVNFPDPQPSNEINLTDDISIKMRWPKYYDILNTGFTSGQGHAADATFDVLTKCIESVRTENEQTLMSEVTKAEQMEFVESLTREQLEKVQEYVESIPKMETDFDYLCEKCGHKNEVHLEGMQNFF